MADDPEDEPCEHIQMRRNAQNPALISACHGGLVNRQSLITVSTLINRLVAGELLGTEAQTAEPAGLVLNDPDAIRSRLAGDGTLTVVPAADVTEPSPQRNWNAWADAKYSWFDGQFDTADSNGPLINLTGGIDYRITDNAVFGLMALYERSKLESSDVFDLSSETEGWGGGAYLGVTLGDHVVFSALVNTSLIDNDYDLYFTNASTDSNRIQASAGFTGYFYPDTSLRWSPSLTVAWSGEWLDSYKDNGGNEFGGQRIETGVWTIGSQMGKTFTLGGESSVEPWAGGFLDYTFLGSTQIDDEPDIEVEKEFDIRVQGGFNLNIASNIQLALTGEIAGIVLDTSNTFSGEANLAIQF